MSAEVKDIDRAAVSQPTSDTEQDEDEQSSELTAPGQRLRAAREAAGLEQAEIAAEMRLDLKLIRALEEGDLEHLPEPVFTAGYLRSYARLMGLPPDELVAQYVDSETRDLPPLDNHRRELPERYRKVAHALPNSFSLSTARRLKDSKSGQQAMMIAGIIVVVIAAAWGTKYWLMRPQTAPLVGQGQVQSDADLKQGKADRAEVIPVQPKTTADHAAAERRASGNKPGTVAKAKPAAKRETAKPQAAADAMIKKSLSLKPLPRSANAPMTLQADAMAPEIDLTKLSLRFSDTSWVDIRDSTGKRLIRELGLKGATKQIAGVAPFTVLLGYGPGVEIAYNGEPFDFSKFQGDRIARFTLHLKDDQLKAKPDESDGLPDDKVPLPEPETD